jgi:hypothetical protein
LITCF